MAAATGLDVLEVLFDGEVNWATPSNLWLLLLGCVVAFIVALLAMKWFVAFLTKYGFKAFGWYRILVGGLILALLVMGIDLQLVD